MTFSVVIAAYNAEGSLPACLGSILSQEGAALEVVCVDDGSTDATRAVVGEVAARDPRVRAFSQPNAGVSAARNAGLTRATGDVVLFVDADDALEPGALAYLSGRFEAERPDCLVFGMRVEPACATPLTLSHRLAPRDVTYEGPSPRLLFGEATHPYAFRVAFRRSFLVEQGILFDTGLTLGEDEAFLLVAYRLSRRTVLSSRPLYVYRMSESSASHRDNASDDVLPAKLAKHRAVIASVLGAWRGRGLDGSCDGGMLSWALDLLLLDVSRLRPAAQQEFWRGLWPVLVGYFGPDGGRSLARGGARACLGDIASSVESGEEARASVVSGPHLVRFYLASRGVRAVAERALARLRGHGAY